ncbi:stage 0 sporulation family protein [uncultured Dysosmobacter sp.]|uniref:PSP1 domain-containing protein n=1 Tax=uncultured Dysosmobacter sp. TaxID=2591384 RepID=UPI002632776D|nr:stage 0 sporulation family protein [uncultured Dysosmobacter sp.]
MTEVISVRFRGGCKNYYFDPKGVQVKMGDQVIVETAQGPEFATCTEGNHEVEDSAIVKPLCAMLRMATDNDRRAVEHNKKKESEAFDICEKKIAEHGLEMKLVNVSASFDGNKIIFYFTADGRVDFRELVRDLAGVFRARIELRQIGVRDEAKMIGGLGICGRPFCCSQFLDSFLPVSIKMAKTQNLSLNPTKISGTCGRLMCCLKYEQNAYEDAAKRMPKAESFVQTPDGPGNVKSVDLLRETVKVSLDSAPEPLKCYHNCEICVLRNGKGSREGIEIPERPARYVEELEEEEFMAPVLATPYYHMDAYLEDAPTRERMGTEGGEKPRRRHRGGRRRSGKAADGTKPEQSKGGEEKKGQQKSRPSKPQAPKQQEPKQPRLEAKAEGGETKRRHRPHHRGGRRRNKGGESGPKSE